MDADEGAPKHLPPEVKYARLDDAVPATLMSATGAQDRQLALHLASQVISTLWLPVEMSETEKERRTGAAIKTLEGIRPGNELEGILGAQMVATHEAAIECLRRSTAARSREGRDQDLKYAVKLLTLFTQQLEALNRLRGKGQQKVTVEYVHIEAGAQAVVGNVETRSTG